MEIPDSRVISYYTRSGLKLELVVKEVLEDILAVLGIDAKLSIVRKAHYDIELLFGRKRGFIEVKGSRDESRLQWMVNEAFRRAHPDPFCVIGVLGFPRRAETLSNAWIWVGPGREGRLGRLNAANFKRWVCQACQGYQGCQVVWERPP
ncbi:MAG: hypothetical protein QXP84_05845 [Candidatus Korarchaeum sp.]